MGGREGTTTHVREGEGGAFGMGLEQGEGRRPLSTDLLTGWQRAETTMRRLRSFRGVPERAGMRQIAVIMGCHSVAGASRSRA
jgi:hypothetical protein